MIDQKIIDHFKKRQKYFTIGTFVVSKKCPHFGIGEIDLVSYPTWVRVRWAYHQYDTYEHTDDLTHAPDHVRLYLNS